MRSETAATMAHNAGMESGRRACSGRTISVRGSENCTQTTTNHQSPAIPSHTKRHTSTIADSMDDLLETVSSRLRHVKQKYFQYPVRHIGICHHFCFCLFHCLRPTTNRMPRNQRDSQTAQTFIVGGLKSTKMKTSLLLIALVSFSNADTMSSVLQSACDTEGSTACYHDPLVNKNGIVQCLDGTVSFVSFCPLFRQSSGLTGCTVAAEGIAACVESTTLAELNTVDAEDSATWSTSIFKEQITPNTAEESAKTELNDLIAPTSATITVTTEGPATTREPSGYISGSTADSASATVLTMDISGASMLL